MIDRLVRGHQPLDKKCFNCIYKKRAEAGKCSIEDCPLLKDEVNVTCEKTMPSIIRL